MIWPPNHNLVPVNIVNFADPKNDQVLITILGVTQNEPINGLGDGDTAPDAVVKYPAAELRGIQFSNTLSSPLMPAGRSLGAGRGED